MVEKKSIYTKNGFQITKQIFLEVFFHNIFHYYYMSENSSKRKEYVAS